MGKVFLNVLNMSITSSYVILFMLLARIILKKAPKIFSYSLWAVVLFRLICPFSLSSTLSLFSFVKQNTMEHIPADIGYMSHPKVSLGIKTVDNLVNGSLPAAAQYTSVYPMQLILAAASLIWIIGIITLVVYSVVSYVLLKRKISTAMLISDNIFESENVKSPFVLGLITPKIYLPINLKESERGYILMHEQTHIKRLDYLIKPFAFFVMCFHWFNPLVWISFILMNHDMEMSCDESVLNRMGKNIKKDYSNSLLSFAAHKNMINGSPLAFGESNVNGRIKNVLSYKKPGFWLIAAAVILVMVFSMGLVTNPKSNRQNLTSLNVNSLENDKVTTVPGNVAKTSNKIVTENEINLNKLIFTLPSNWTKRGNESEIFFDNENKQTVGGIRIVGYYGDYRASLPNHSKILNTEDVDSSLGKGKLFTLELSNPAASNNPNTWNEIHAIIPLNNNNMAYDIWVNVKKDTLINILKSLH